MVKAFRAEEAIPGTEYTLAIDIAIIDALEDEFDLPFDELIKLLNGKIRIGRMARLLRGLLSRHHPDMTLDEAGALAMECGEELGDALARLFEKATPEADGEAKAENPPKAHRGTGASSSSRGARQGSRPATSGSKRREPSFSS